MSGLDVVVAVVIAVGVVGTLVPLLPGSLLVLGAVLAWTVATGGSTAWIVLGVVVALLAAGMVVKYVVPGRRLRAGGVPTSTMLLGAAVALVGLFVVPVVGLPLGFVLGVYLAEWRRLRDRSAAWPATVHAVRAVGLGMLIELTAALGAAATWAVGVALR